MQHRADTVKLDAPRVNPDVAVELMIHHLSLAAMYFGATPDDNGEHVSEELQRILAPEFPGHVNPAMIGAQAFVNVLTAHYESLKDLDDDEEPRARAWTDVDIDWLKELWKVGVPITEIASKMRRSKQAIEHKRRLLKLTPRETHFPNAKRS